MFRKNKKINTNIAVDSNLILPKYDESNTNRPRLFATDTDDASDTKTKVLDELIKNDTESDPADVDIMMHNERGKKVIINKQLERKRMLSRRIEKIILIILSAVVFVTVFGASYYMLFKSEEGDKLNAVINSDKRIDEYGNLIFEKYADRVTVGDEIEKAFSLLGVPDSTRQIEEKKDLTGIDNSESVTREADDTSVSAGNENVSVVFMHFYGDSYIISERGTVIGYYKKFGTDMKLTVGYREGGLNPLISVGDSAERIIKKLGSPDYYLGRSWIYEGMTMDFARSNSKSVYDLHIQFDDNYTLQHYDFIK